MYSVVRKRMNGTFIGVLDSIVGLMSSHIIIATTTNALSQSTKTFASTRLTPLHAFEKNAIYKINMALYRLKNIGIIIKALIGGSKLKGSRISLITTATNHITFKLKSKTTAKLRGLDWTMKSVVKEGRVIRWSILWGCKACQRTRRGRVMMLGRMKPVNS